jgi:hypothetical protein
MPINPNIKYVPMTFADSVAPFAGRRVKKITNENNEVAIIFNDRFGAAMYFTKNGKFKYVGATTRYGVHGNNPNKLKFYCRRCEKYYFKSKCKSTYKSGKGKLLKALVFKCPKGHGFDEK